MAISAEELFSIVRIGLFLIVSGAAGVGISIALQATRPATLVALGIGGGPFCRQARQYKDAA